MKFPSSPERNNFAFPLFNQFKTSFLKILSLVISSPKESLKSVT
jgi:hypothetical protein